MSTFNKRADGRVEWVCIHGIGHTIYEPNLNNREGKYAYSHGCDGCCIDTDRNGLMELYMEERNNE